MNDTNIGKLSKKSNRKAKKVTDLKKKKNLMKMQWKENVNEFEINYVNVIFGSNSTFHLFLIASFFSLSKSY